MNQRKTPLQAIKAFIEHESFSGVLLALAAALALVVANSSLAEWYKQLLYTEVGFSFGDFSLIKSFRHLVDDGLMAIFFFVVGLELKREYVEGELSRPDQRLLPTFAAAGGVILPALVYMIFNFNHPESSHGWAIPCATDIAFSLAVLTLVGNRVPFALKVFLSTLAVVDDLIAVLIIAAFYTESIDYGSLIKVAILALVLLGLNLKKVKATQIYILIGIPLWYFMLKSGVHATIAGVLLAMLIPSSKISSLEHAFHPWVAYLILPIFAFCNTGLDLSQFSTETMVTPVTLGISLGLLIGKPVGILVAVILGQKLLGAQLPRNCNLSHILGAGFLAGIGFTMSLFISGLSFNEPILEAESKFAVFTASMIAAAIGWIILKKVSSKDIPQTE